MSRRGNGYGNAQAELFRSRLKTELLDGGSFAGLEEARLKVAHYIAYHNEERCHSSLGYQAPNHFKTQLQLISQRCPARLDFLSYMRWHKGTVFLLVIDGIDNIIYMKY